MRSLFGLLIGLGVIGGFFVPARMSAAVAASPSATPSPTPPPYFTGNHAFSTASPLPTNRISIDGGATWMAIDVFYPPYPLPSVANIQAAPPEKVIIKAALAKDPTPSTMLVYYLGKQWTLINPKVVPINYDPYTEISVLVTSIIAPLPDAVTVVVPKYISGLSPTPSPTPPLATIFHPFPTPSPSPTRFRSAPLKIRPGDRLSFDDGANWIPVDRVVFPVIQHLPGRIEPPPPKPDQLWINNGWYLGAIPSTVRRTLLVYADGQTWSYSLVFLRSVAFSPDRKDTIYDIEPAPTPSPSPSPGSGGIPPVSGHGAPGSTPVEPERTPTPTPTPSPMASPVQ